MSEMKKLEPPLREADVRLLIAGDEVLISGVMYTAPIIYFVGPTPARPGRVIGAAGPTTSSRMDPFSPKLIAKGLRAMVGKGYRGAEVREALKKHGAVHITAIGGAGALLSKHIVAAEVIAYEDLGTEAIRKLEVVDFPGIVAYDAQGNTVYK
ncbi:MAG: fumarate hydratase C-terminal domain-containing protein [Planctomycetota bacterium]|jgi:fumarate hydratase subunit beta